MNTNKTISKEENIRRCLGWVKHFKERKERQSEMFWLQRIIDHSEGKIHGEEPMPPVMLALTGRPKRDTVINADDILNLRIALERNEI